MGKKTKTAILLLFAGILLLLFLIFILTSSLLRQNRVLKEENQRLQKTYEQLSRKKQKTKIKRAELKKMEEENSQEEQQFSTEDQKTSTQEAGKVHNQEKKIVAIDPGHQGWNVDMSEQEPIAPGASEMKAKATSGTEGRYTNLPEYQLNLDVSLKLRDELEKRGYEVVMTRENNDTAISNSERAKKAAQSGAEIFIRIHADGEDGGSSANGACAMISTKDNPYVGELYEESRALAKEVLTAYCEKTKLKQRDILEVDNMSGINWSQIPVMILEMGFMSNESDDTYMADSENQTKMAEGIANGVDAYFADNSDTE